MATLTTDNYLYTCTIISQKMLAAQYYYMVLLYLGCCTNSDIRIGTRPRGPQLFRIMSMAIGISRNHCWNQQITLRFLVQES